MRSSDSSWALASTISTASLLQATVSSRSDSSEESDLELTVACSSEAVLMVEASAHELSEDRMVEAIEFAQAELQPVIELIERMRAETGLEKRDFEPATTVDEELAGRVAGLAREAGLVDLLLTEGKSERTDALKEVRSGIIEQLVGDPDAEENEEQVRQVKDAFRAAEDA